MSRSILGSPDLGRLHYHIPQSTHPASDEVELNVTCQARGIHELVDARPQFNLRVQGPLITGFIILGSCYIPIVIKVLWPTAQAIYCAFLGPPPPPPHRWILLLVYHRLSQVLRAFEHLLLIRTPPFPS